MSEYEQVINIFLALGGIAIAFFLIQILIGLICLIVTLVAQSKVHQKANKPGWTAIIPYYSQYVRAEIGGNVTYFWPFFIASLVSGACRMAEYSENEILTSEDKYNDLIITALRTKWGLDINLIEPKFLKHFHAEAEKFIKENHLQITPEGKAILTHSGIFISDYIMRELMI